MLLKQLFSGCFLNFFFKFFFYLIMLRSYLLWNCFCFQDNFKSFVCMSLSSRYSNKPHCRSTEFTAGHFNSQNSLIGELTERSQFYHYSALAWKLVEDRCLVTLYCWYKPWNCLSSLFWKLCSCWNACQGKDKNICIQFGMVLVKRNIAKKVGVSAGGYYKICSNMFTSSVLCK